MRHLATIGGSALALLAAGVAMAAGPTQPATTPPPTGPATTAVPAPAKTSTSAGAAASTSGTTSSGDTWTATINPLHVATGSAKVVQNADGTGTITVSLDGLRADTRWAIQVLGGTSTSFREGDRMEIATRSGVAPDKAATDTVTIQLSKAEMKRLASERSKSGFVVLVSDGANRSAAVFQAG